MTEPPRRLPPTPEERVKTVVTRMAGGSDAGSTRFARPIPGASQATARSVPPLKTGDRYAPLGWGPGLLDPIPDKGLPVGSAATVEGIEGVAVGDGPTAFRAGVAVGFLAVAGSPVAAGAVAVGFNPQATADSAIAIGFNAAASDAAATAVGAGATVGAIAGIALGNNAEVDEGAGCAIAVGTGAWANSDGLNAVVLGRGAFGGGLNGISIGYGAQVNAAGAVAIGADSAGGAAQSSTADEIVLGTALHTVRVNTPLHTTAGSASGLFLPIRTADGVVHLLPLYNTA